MKKDDRPIGDFSDHGGPNEKYGWYAVYGFVFLSAIVLCVVGAINPKQPEFEKPKSTKFICDCETVNTSEVSKTYDCVCKSNQPKRDKSALPLHMLMKEKQNGR